MKKEAIFSPRISRISRIPAGTLCDFTNRAAEFHELFLLLKTKLNFQKIIREIGGVAIREMRSRENCDPVGKTIRMIAR